jgi:hypothetical protein
MLRTYLSAVRDNGNGACMCHVLHGFNLLRATFATIQRPATMSAQSMLSDFANWLLRLCMSTLTVNACEEGKHHIVVDIYYYDVTTHEIICFGKFVAPNLCKNRHVRTIDPGPVPDRKFHYLNLVLSLAPTQFPGHLN